MRNQNYYYIGGIGLMGSEEVYTYVKKGKFRDGSAKIIIHRKFKGSIMAKNLPKPRELWFILEERTFSDNLPSKEEDISEA